jgi:hypothetical protein
MTYLETFCFFKLWNVTNELGLYVTKFGWQTLQWDQVTWTNSWSPFSWDPMDGFGVDEQLVHFGVHLSQGLNVFETQCPGTKTCGPNCD